MPQATTTTFKILSNNSSEILLGTTVGMTIAVSHATPTVALSINGTTVFRELHAFERMATDADCIPVGWKPLDKNQAASLRSPDGVGCLRHTRTLAPDEDVYVIPLFIRGCCASVLEDLMFLIKTITCIRSDEC